MAPRREPTGEIRDRGTAFVLDASALLAMLQDEPGGEMVEVVLENSVISAVNWSEVVQKARSRGVDTEGFRPEVEALGLTIVPFTSEDGDTAARLWDHTRAAGLSLGDRACLALARRLGIPALTTDRAWSKVPLPVEVELLR